MLFLEWLRWRCTRRRVLRQAGRLLDDHGESAFFRVQESASEADGLDRRLEARFWRAVGSEIARRLARQRLIASMLTGNNAQAAKMQSAADVEDDRPEAEQMGENAVAWATDIQSRPLTIPDICTVPGSPEAPTP